ncbi:alpha/beta fold hydrolase [Geodermatophilus marinus]|uniref:alpha/beta fold hydrolase n=1 Tax=Geodermatophilus sp. LHW52908 TaxID=2303986 RepID=UPI000E3E97EB|nr:alpha/beta fold hydrolase [Geodermatophilus sp. LHW52908]RFU20706.1 alpha/beta hydrolase [Geodermatophilus sp. LHW52908]
MTEHVTTSAGDTVGYDRRGEGPAVVFVAGAGPFRAIDPRTTETAEILADRGFSTVVHDRVGRADSFREGRMGLADELAAVAAVIEVAGGRAVLCGHSSGCAIALRAAHVGLPVDGLVLFEAPLDPVSPGVREWTAELYRLLDAGDRGGAVAHYMADIPLDVLQGLRDSPLWGPFVRHAESLRADAEALERAMSAPHAELFGDLHVPTLLVVGEETLEEMPAAAASLAAALPDATRAEVAGSEHSWEPRAMADLLARFTGDRRSSVSPGLARR